MNDLPSDTLFAIQSPEQRTQTLQKLREIKVMPVLGKNELEIDNLKDVLGGKAKVLADAGIYVVEGTARAENYRDAIQILAEIRDKDSRVIPAWGTHTNIVSIHYATQFGIPIAVAADKMPVLAGRYTLPERQIADAQKFIGFVRDHIESFVECLKLGNSEKDAIYENPLSMDPIAYCIAREVIAFPAWSTRAELGDLLVRGATTDKVFPYNSRNPAGWNELIVATSSDYVREGSMGTGGLGIKLFQTGGSARQLQDLQLQNGSGVSVNYADHQYVDTVTPCLKTKGFIAAGASDLGKGTIDDVANSAALYKNVLNIG
ncbi:hypothetical protein J4401_01740 [Candidatus Woesearchaeota archaeon]|nr:hypothetical protein [Candidatus Woesearchaeota archaeon]